MFKLLGKGSFGNIYLARDIDKPHQIWAIEQLVPQTQISPEVKQLFEREARKLQSLGEHPQIPTLREYFVEDNYLYLVREFISGQNLEKKRKQLSVFNENQIKEFLRYLLPVLKFIHSQKVVHRNIKPENIICRYPDNKYFLIDFALSQELSSVLVIPQGKNSRSDRYTAPEQYRGLTTPVSDLFSLGVSCFYLLSGINPQKLSSDRGDNWLDNWRQHIKTPLSQKMVFILDKLLQKDISKRYQDAAQVIGDLQHNNGSITAPKKKFYAQKTSSALITANFSKSRPKLSYLIRRYFVKIFPRRYLLKIFLICGLASFTIGISYSLHYSFYFLIVGLFFALVIISLVAYQNSGLSGQCPLIEGEQLLQEGPASHSLEGENSHGWLYVTGGWLYLTNKRLFFRSGKFNAEAYQLSLPLGEILEVQPSLTAFVFPNSLHLLTKDGKEQFIVVVKDRRNWVRKINRARLNRDRDGSLAPKNILSLEQRKKIKGKMNLFIFFNIILFPILLA
ncbi:MAG: protein kinase [Prochloraceae cyanobacterium]